MATKSPTKIAVSVFTSKSQPMRQATAPRISAVSSAWTTATKINGGASAPSKRKIKRADKRIDNAARTRTKLMVARDLGEGTLIAPAQMTLGAGQALREVDRRVVDMIARHPVAAQQKSLDKVMALVRGKLPGLGPDR